jgi:hypothetical protein
MTPEVVFAGVVFAALAAATIFQTVGPELLEPTTLDTEGVACTEVDGELVPADPAQLARGAHLDPNVLALARVLVSEAGDLPEIAQTGVGWTVVNHARKSGRSVLSVITAAKIKSGDTHVDGTGAGYFGSQGNPVGGYRYVASSRNSTDDSRALAAAIYAGDVEDPTGGALNFDSPNSYGAQAGTTAAGADAFAAKREAEGKTKVVLEGTSESQIRFWVPA